MIDPELRLRTVRTAASTIAEATRSETRREAWRRRRNKSMMRKGTLGRNFFRRGGAKEPAVTEDDPRDVPTTPQVPTIDGKVLPPAGKRRDIYVNLPLPPSSLDAKGEPVTR